MAIHRERKYSDFGVDNDKSEKYKISNNDYLANKQKYKQRRRVIGESVNQSTNVMKSTTASNQHQSNH